MPKSATSTRSPKLSSLPRLQRIVALLRDAYRPVEPPPSDSAFALILWEKVAYLATDEKRAAAFAALKQRVGLTPRAILDASRGELEAICALGGAVGISERAKNMHDAAALVFEAFNGDLEPVVAGPARDAKRALQRFRGIGEPGAERVMLLRRAHHVLALDSNGLRTIVRLGFGYHDKNYTRMYRSAADAARPELVDDFDWLIDAHVYLRHHGQEACKTSAPRCESCAVHADCSYVKATRPRS